MPDDRNNYRPSREDRERSRYLDSLTDAGRSRFHAIRNHRFADSIGGDSSNYKW